MIESCPHLSQLDRAAGLRCSCSETRTIPAPRPHRRRSRTMAVARVFGPYVVVILAVTIVGLVTGAIERI